MNSSKNVRERREHLHQYRFLPNTESAEREIYIYIYTSGYASDHPRASDVFATLKKRISIDVRTNTHRTINSTRTERRLDHKINMKMKKKKRAEI